MHAAVAAGLYPTIADAARPDGPHPPQRLQPDPATARVYDQLYADYVMLHDYFGRGDNDVMKRLKALEPFMSVDALRRDLASLHLELPRNGLVTWTSGNISARDFHSDTMLIKPSGVTFDALTPDGLVQCNYDGRVLNGRFKPSSDTTTHGYIYRHMPSVGGVVHTHSPYTTAWAATSSAKPAMSNGETGVVRLFDDDTHLAKGRRHQRCVFALERTGDPAEARRERCEQQCAVRDRLRSRWRNLADQSVLRE